MPTCVQSLQSKIDQGTLDSIEQLTPETNMSIYITSSVKQLFRVEIVKQETAKFTISLVTQQQPTNIGVTVTFYQIGTGNVIINLGSAQITEMILEFQKDFSPGTYYICIGSTTFTYTGTFRGEFAGYQIYALMKPNAFHGQALNPVEVIFPPGERVCNKVLWYQILEGSLPPGLIMTQLGRIEGILPNMDCIDENADLSPSQNWYYNLGSSWQPWGRQWRFFVRVWIWDYPEAISEQWFCIRIHNNWSWDRDNFKPPFEYDIIEPDPVSPPRLPEEICCEPQPEPEPFVPAIVPQLCPCDGETPTEQAIQLNFLQWYQSVLLNPPGESNPHIQSFIDNFKDTDYFKQMMTESGLESEMYTFEELELKAVEQRIEYYMSQLNADGRGSEDIDTIMLTLKDEENQKLPITIEGCNGASVYCEVS